MSVKGYGEAECSICGMYHCEAFYCKECLDEAVEESKAQQWQLDQEAIDTITGLYEKQLAEVYQALQDDTSDLWRVTNAIKKEIEARDWILEGRGAYKWDDNRYKDETRITFEAVIKLIDEVQHPAQKRFHATMNKCIPLIRGEESRDE